jgi:hypothetical protein
MQRVVIIGLAVLLAVTAVRVPSGYGQAEAAAQEEPSAWSDLGWGAAAVGTNLGYIPAKTIYALGGGLVALLAFGLTAGDSDTAQGILHPAFGGTWVVTPDMLQGKEPILFVGPSYEPQR